MMPVHNGDVYLTEAITSILGQTFENFEFIVIDDGSTDKSLEVIRAFERSDTRMKVLSREKKGLVASLNEAIKFSSGQLLARMDADDVAHPERFEKQVEHLARNPECVVLGTGVIVVDPDGDEICRPTVETEHRKIDDQLLLNKGGRICHPTVMMRKCTVEAVGGYRPLTPFEDVDLFLRLAERGKVANLPECLLRYRLQLSSISHTIDPSQREAKRLAVVKSACQRRGLLLPSGACSSQADYSARPADCRREALRRWSYDAATSGNTRVALKHGLRALIEAPLNTGCWWTISVAVFGARSTERIWRFKRRLFNPRSQPNPPR